MNTTTISGKYGEHTTIKAKDMAEKAITGFTLYEKLTIGEAAVEIEPNAALFTKLPLH